MDGRLTYSLLILVISIAKISSQSIWTTTSINKKLFNVGETLAFRCEVSGQLLSGSVVQIYKAWSKTYFPQGYMDATGPVIISNNTDLDPLLAGEPTVAPRYTITKERQNSKIIFILTITDIQVEDFGGYSCQVIFDQSLTVTSTIYDVDIIGTLYSVDIMTSNGGSAALQDPSRQTIANNSILTSGYRALECVFNFTGVFPNVFIGLAGENITERFSQYPAGNSLKTRYGPIRQLEVLFRYSANEYRILKDERYIYDGKTFMCSVELGGKNTTASVTLNITYPPRDIECEKDITKERLVITCSCHGNPTPTSRWVTIPGTGDLPTAPTIRNEIDGRKTTSSVTITDYNDEILTRQWQFEAINNEGQPQAKYFTLAELNGCSKVGFMSIRVLTGLIMTTLLFNYGVNFNEW